MSPVLIHGCKVVLRKITHDDLEVLWRWRNDDRFLHFCSVRRDPIGIKEFDREMENDFSYDRHKQFLIYRKSDPISPIGTIYSYNFNSVDGHAFVTTYIAESDEKRGFGVLAFATFCQYLFETFSLFKIYTEAYEYNVASLGQMLRGGMIEEGRFGGHRLVDGRRWDLVRLALYRSHLCILRRISHLDSIVVTL